MRKNPCTWVIFHFIWNFLETHADQHGGGGVVAFAQLGDLDNCCLVFPSESVMRACLGYFLSSGTTLHLRVESGACIIPSIIDLNC